MNHSVESNDSLTDSVRVNTDVWHTEISTIMKDDDTGWFISVVEQVVS